MSADPRLRRIAELAAMLREQELQRLAAAAAACAESRAQLAAVERGCAPAGDACPVEQARVGLAHRLWAVEAAATINRRLALQTAELISRRKQSAQAFGRAEVLERLTLAPANGRR